MWVPVLELNKPCTLTSESVFLRSFIDNIIYPRNFKTILQIQLRNLFQLVKPLCLMGDINIDLLKSTHYQFVHDSLSTLLSCYLIPTIDKLTRMHRSSATLVDNIFINNPEQVSLSGNISDISNHFL